MNEHLMTLASCATLFLLSSPAAHGATGTQASVSVSISVQLSALHPAVTRGALQCGAVVQTRSWVDAHRASLTDFASVTQWVLGTAHYFGQQSLLEFPVTNRSYSGQLTYSATLSAQTITAPDAMALIACWLMLNGQPAAWDKGPGLQVVGTSNFSGVDSNPLVIGEVPVSTAASASGSLSAKGTYFAPGPVQLVATVQGDRRALARNARPAGTMAPSVASAASGTAPMLTQPGAAAGTAPANAPPPLASKAITAVPPIVGLTVQSSSAVTHQLQWRCADGEALQELCYADSTGDDTSDTYTYEFAKKDPTETSFTTLSSPTGLSSTEACNGYLDSDSGYCVGATVFILHLGVTTFLVPQVTIRVTRKDPTGAHLASYADFVYASPPQVQEPAGFAASEDPFGQVNLTWQPVPAAVGYLISEKGNHARAARVTGTRFSFKTTVAGTHTYQIATAYSVATPPPSNPPEASVLVHPVGE